MMTMNKIEATTISVVASFFCKKEGVNDSNHRAGVADRQLKSFTFKEGRLMTFPRELNIWT